MVRIRFPPAANLLRTGWRLARNTIIESTFEVGRRFRCTMRVNCGQLDPGRLALRSGRLDNTVDAV
jgi:hypothetical protein